MFHSKKQHHANLEKTRDNIRSGPSSAWRLLLNLFFVAILCAFIALLITVFSSTAVLTINLVMSFSLGFSIFFITVFLHLFLNPEKPNQMALISLVALGAGILSGMQIGPWILRYYFSTDIVWQNNFIQSITICIVASSSATYFFYSIRRSRLANALIKEERIRRLAIEKEALEGKLRMLQAQIEPHFLFNTLSHVISLMDTNPARGKTMLMDLTHYLRTSLTRTLPDKTTLGQEIEMIRAYLGIQKIRMNERLNFTIDLPEHLSQQPFPPMLLQPLVENALKHGLEPELEGGEIVIRALAENQCLRIEISDTGSGLANFHRTGVGLTNVRERLSLLYGNKGKLALEENTPQGLRAVIEVPIHDR